ncbi:MAG: TlpA family protein disulfide reductase [Acidimicrobiales bacterium]
MSAASSSGASSSAAGQQRPRRRLVLWISLGVAVALAVLVAVLATSGPVSQQAADSPLVGKAAPGVNGPAAGGRTVSLAGSSGKWVLVNFAASWCVPCQAELPQLLLFAHQHAAAGDATILTVEYDQSDLARLRALLRDRGASWPAVDDQGAVVDYGVTGIPESYLVDPQGTVVEKLTGGVQAGQVYSVISRLSAGRSS